MPRQLFISQRSPFARKVQILLREKGLPFELHTIDLQNRTPQFQALSPLGKVPLLVDEDSTLVFDSTVIADYLEDRYPTPPLLGVGHAERLKHRLFDELADTLAEQAITLFFHKDEAAACARAKALLARTFAELSKRIKAGDVPKDFGLAHAALIGALGYAEFRLPGFSAGHPELPAFVAPHLERPSVKLSPPPRD